MPALAQECPQTGENAPAALHRTWMMEGWERAEGDPEFVFATKMERYYDLDDPMGVFYDNFAPGETQLFDNGAIYGAKWEDLQNAARSVRHALTGGNDAIVDDDVASTTLGFVGRIDRLDGQVIAFDGRSQLGWKCVGGIWKIRQELNYAAVVDPAEIERFYNEPGGNQMTDVVANHPYVGLWVTADCNIRHELRADGRYVEARGHRERAYEGRYEVIGNQIDYWDDTGFTADGTFRDDVLYHAGMILTRH